MADFGFDFRGALGDATDPSNCQFAHSTKTYPTTNAGVTFGWEQSIGGDVSRAIGAPDARLVGISYFNNNIGTGDFRIDLPATGIYDIRLAIGDEPTGGAWVGQKCLILDTTTTLATITKAGTLANDHFLDATNVERTSSADWVTNNAKATLTFSTTICRIRIGANNSDSANFTTLAHVRVTTALDTLMAQSIM